LSGVVAESGGSNGEGKFRRHIKLASVEDITGKHVHDYLDLAFKMSAKT
jgi:hypothetical protein